MPGLRGNVDAIVTVVTAQGNRSGAARAAIWRAEAARSVTRCQSADEALAYFDDSTGTRGVCDHDGCVGAWRSESHKRWCCRERRWSVGQPSDRDGGTRGRGLASWHRPVPRGPKGGRRPSCSGGRRRRARHDPLLCVAVDDRRPRPWRSTVLARRRCGVLPVAFPQPHASWRRCRGRASRRQSWPRGAQRRPRAEGCGLGARRGPGRTGGTDHLRSADVAVPSALAHAVRCRCSGRDCHWGRPRGPDASGRRKFPVDAGSQRSGDGHPRRSAAPERLTGGRALVGRGGLWTHGNVPYRRTHGGRNRADLPAPTAGHAFIARHGLAERRRLGAA